MQQGRPAGKRMRCVSETRALLQKHHCVQAACAVIGTSALLQKHARVQQAEREHAARGVRALRSRHARLAVVLALERLHRFEHRVRGLLLRSRQRRQLLRRCERERAANDVAPPGTSCCRHIGSPDLPAAGPARGAGCGLGWATGWVRARRAAAAWPACTRPARTARSPSKRQEPAATGAALLAADGALGRRAAAGPSA